MKNCGGKGRLGRFGDRAGRNASERRAGFETDDAEADPLGKWGRPTAGREASDRMFDTMEAEYRHVYHMLTKRSSLMRKHRGRKFADDSAPDQIRCGVSVEGGSAIAKTEQFRTAPAAVRFQPIGSRRRPEAANYRVPLGIRRLCGDFPGDRRRRKRSAGPTSATGLGLVGPRPLRPGGVPFFFKKRGE